MSSVPPRITDLRLEGVTKRFPGVLACDHISLDVGAGQVLALVGENGAGKTTLMNILMGLYQPDEGRILINGKETKFRSPNDAYACGIGMVHQHFMLVPNMTVAENVALGSKDLHHFLNLDLKTAKYRIAEIAERYSLPVPADALVSQLSVGEQQRAELVKTLCFGAQFLILDEPTSALTPQETDELIELLKRMTGELSIIFISHKLNEVKALSDTVTVLRRGTVVFRGNTADHSSANIAALMTGHEVILPHNECEDGCGKPILKISNLSVRGDRGYAALDGLDLELRAGEIVGLAGVSGNGQRELADVLAGLRPAVSGSIIFEGKELLGTSPREIIDSGIGYVPEDRHDEGIVPSFSIRENLVLKDFASTAFTSGPFLKLAETEKNAQELIKRFDIRCPSSSTAAGSLSGGNIQKVILARELARKPATLIAVYPTRGLDMGASEFIHNRLLELRKSGTAVLLISEELEEILNLSDRVAVIYKGKILKTLPAPEATRQKLGILMAGLVEEG
ncbi:MAG: ABC transporter ATP-binding protein, partial [Treponemataceae bacterium]